MRNQAVTGLPDTYYRMRVSEGKRLEAAWQLELQGELVPKIIRRREEILQKLE